MSSISSSGKPEALAFIESRVEYITCEMAQEFHSITDGLKQGRTALDRKTLELFRRKWFDECKSIEDRIFTLSISPGAQRYVPEAEQKLAKIKNTIDSYISALEELFVPSGEPPLPEAKSEEEKAREKEERRKRMEAFQRGEKPEGK